MHSIRMTLLRKCIVLFFAASFLTACDGANNEKKTDTKPDKQEPQNNETFSDLTKLYSILPNRNILWGFKNMYHPCIVKREDSDYPYLMYFFGWAATDTNVGWPGCDAIFLARGKDFDKWEVYSKKKDMDEYYWDMPANGKYNVEEWCPVLCASETWFDSWHIGDPSVVLKDGRYYMAASSYGMDKDMMVGGPAGDISCIMGAVSDDGIHFTKTDYPIAIWEPEIGKNEPVTGDSRYPVDFGANEFYGLYHRPSIRWDEEDNCWKMWFDYISSDLMGMGYAENHGDFMNPSDWKVIRADDKPCLAHMCNPDVIKIAGRYICYGDPDVIYYGADNARLHHNGWTRRQLCEAQSTDGLNWTVTGFIMPDFNTWANHVPCLYYEQGKLYIFYATQIGFGNINNPGNDYDYRYEYIRYMSRPVNYSLEP